MGQILQVSLVSQFVHAERESSLSSYHVRQTSRRQA